MEDRQSTVREELVEMQSMIEMAQHEVTEAMTKLDVLSDDLGLEMLGGASSSLSRLASKLRGLVGRRELIVDAR